MIYVATGRDSKLRTKGGVYKLNMDITSYVHTYLLGT